VGELLVSLGREVEPKQMAPLTDAEESAVADEEGASSARGGIFRSDFSPLRVSVSGMSISRAPDFFAGLEV